MRSFAALILAFILSNSLCAQNRNTKEEKKEISRLRRNELLKLEEEGESFFKRHSVFSMKLNTDGYGFGYEYGLIKSAYKTNFFQIELNEKKHRKEEKQYRVTQVPTQIGPIWVEGRYFVYGKQNNFFQAKLGYGQQRMIGNKGNKNGIAVYFTYSGGISVGLLKPYYLGVVDTLTSPGRSYYREIKYSKELDSLFLFSDFIEKAGFSKGLNEMKLVPGIYAKTALRFDWGRFNNTISAIEVGLNLELYAQTIPQMVAIAPKRLFGNTYIALNFGRRK